MDVNVESQRLFESSTDSSIKSKINWTRSLVRSNVTQTLSPADSSLHDVRPKRLHRQTKKAIEAQEVEQALRKKSRRSNESSSAASSSKLYSSVSMADANSQVSATPTFNSRSREICKTTDRIEPSNNVPVSELATTVQNRLDSLRQASEAGSISGSDVCSSSPAASPPSMDEGMDDTVRDVRDKAATLALNTEASRAVAVTRFYGLDQSLDGSQGGADLTLPLPESLSSSFLASFLPESKRKGISDIPGEVQYMETVRRQRGRIEYVWRAPSPAGKRAVIDASNILDTSSNGGRLRRQSNTVPRHVEKSLFLESSPNANGHQKAKLFSPAIAILPARRPRRSALGALTDSNMTATRGGAESTRRFSQNPAPGLRRSARTSKQLISMNASLPMKIATAKQTHIAIRRGPSYSRVASDSSFQLSDPIEVFSSSEDETEPDSMPIVRSFFSPAMQPTSSGPSTALSTHRRSKTSAKRRSNTSAFLTAGLYAADFRASGSINGPSASAEAAGLHTKAAPSTFPEPIFRGQNLLTGSRDFSLPREILEKQDKLRARVDLKRKPPSYRHISRNQYVSRPKLNGELPICHCHPSSNCGDDCLNRIVQMVCSPKTCPCGERCTNISLGKRPRARCDVAWYGARGFGLKTLDDIPQYSLVDEYRGEIINLAEVVSRVNEIYKNTGNFYFLDYDAPAGEVLDGGLRGNITRFANHSCNPNCYIEKWIVCGTDEERTAEYQVGLFALRDIKAGEEITYDYGWSDWNKVRGFVDNPLVDKTPQSCHCGAANCCGVLGGKKASLLRDGSAATPSTSATPPLSTMAASVSSLGKRSRNEHRKRISKVEAKAHLNSRKSAVNQMMPSRASTKGPHHKIHVSSSSPKRLRLDSELALNSSTMLEVSIPGQAARRRACRGSSSEPKSSLASTDSEPRAPRPARQRAPASLLPVILTKRAGRSAHAMSGSAQHVPVRSVPSLSNANSRTSGNTHTPMYGCLSSADAGRLLATALRGGPLPSSLDLPRAALAPGWAMQFADSEDETVSSRNLSESRQEQASRDAGMAEAIQTIGSDEDYEDVDEHDSSLPPPALDHQSKRARTLVRSRELDATLTPAQRVQLGLPSWPLGKPDIGKNGQPVRYNPANRAPKAPIRVKDYPSGTKFFTAAGRPVNRSAVDVLSKQRFIYSGEELEVKRANRRLKNAESARLRRVRKRYEDLIAMGRTQQAQQLADEESGIFADASTTIESIAVAKDLAKNGQTAQMSSGRSGVCGNKVPTVNSALLSIAHTRARGLPHPSRRAVDQDDSESEGEQESFADATDTTTPIASLSIPFTSVESKSASMSIATTTHGCNQPRSSHAPSATPAKAPARKRVARKLSKLSWTDSPLPSGLYGGNGFIPGLPAEVANAEGPSQHDARRARNTFLARVRRFIQRGNTSDEALKMASEMVFKGHENTPLAVARARAEANRSQASAQSPPCKPAVSKSAQRNRGRPRKHLVSTVKKTLVAPSRRKRKNEVAAATATGSSSLNLPRLQQDESAALDSSRVVEPSRGRARKMDSTPGVRKLIVTAKRGLSQPAKRGLSQPAKRGLSQPRKSLDLSGSPATTSPSQISSILITKRTRSGRISAPSKFIIEAGLP